VNADGTGSLALGIRYDTCAGSDLWFPSIAIVRSGRAFEIASSAQGLVSGRATRQEPLEPQGFDGTPPAGGRGSRPTAGH